jgi:serine phosphatase RsbU (regulator of sigma subunit)
MGILPDPASIEGLPENVEARAVLEPAGMVGGDLYDALMMDAQRFFFMIGDVSGKGIPASLFMALSKTLTKSAALRGHPSLGELMVRANQEISRDNPEQLFVTTTACILDVTTGQMDYCIAGHGSPILLSEGKGPMTLESEGGPPLCTLEDFPYPVSSYRLEPGDLIVLITDGVTEAHNQGGEVYGNERVLKYLSGLAWQDGKGPSAESVCLGLFEDVKGFCPGSTPFDDIAIMAVRFKGPA